MSTFRHFHRWSNEFARLGVLHAACWCCLLLAASALAQESNARPQPYRIEIIGLDGTDLQDEFEDFSEALQRRDDPLETDTQLRRRMNTDVETFGSLLRAHGYYNHQIEVEITQREGRRVGRFIVHPGPVFRFNELSITSTDPEFAGALLTPADVGLETGKRALAQLVVDSDAQILRALTESGHPFPSIVDREATIDFDTNTMDVRFVVDPGPRAAFGDLQIEGLDKVKPIVAELERPWEPGDLFDSRKVDTYRTRMYDTALFTVVRVQPVSPVIDGQVPIRLEVTERSHRTVGIGFSYYTDRGAGAEFFWEHRNLWQRGRKLRLEANVAQLEQSFATILTVDRFKRRGQRLVARISGGFEETDAYESQKIGAALIVERELRQHLKGSVGVAVRFSEVEQLNRSEHFQLFSFPLALSWDNSDDALDPTRGVRLALHAEPFIDFIGDTSQFLKTELILAYYIALDSDADWVFAHRVKLGSILTESFGDVPADERFYAGGGGSIRGYPYQLVGPLFADREPIGGLSLVETAFEIRYRFTETFGAVAFVDGGSAFESSYPDFDETIRWGVGTGIRYYSPIGPFRFDVAVPLNKDDHIDRSFQVYISLGQAF